MEQDKKTPAQNFGELFEAFGNAISQIFDDPELKQKAKDFGQSTVSAAETFGKRFKDEEVKVKVKAGRGIGLRYADVG